jgi:SAM-dependent methyltransferase
MDRPQVFETLNGAAKNGDVFAALRKFPLDAVADALLEMPSEYSDARAALPRMAPDDVQDSWTGNHGHTLLFQSCAFVRSIESGFMKHTGRQLRDTRILDYGCGWGRLIRLMYAFTAPENIYGCDPWYRSIELCHDSAIKANLAVCDYLPTEVPFPRVKFDLIYAFSVFTHLSEKTADAVMGVCRKTIADDGLLAITIRPESYWYVHKAPADLDLMHALHRAGDYAFTPHSESRSGFKMRSKDGIITYGDASFSLEYMKKRWTDWEVIGTDVNLLDPYQTIVFLKPTNLG